MKHDPIKDLIPKKGWLKTYFNYIQETEMCERYSLLTALCAIGSLINNKVSWTRVEGLFAPIYPNPWVMLIGPPGIGHKTSAMELVHNLILELPRPQRPRMVSEKITPEALVKALAVPEPKETDKVRILKKTDATALIYVPELATVLGKVQYNIGMVTLLTRLYDCPKEWSSDTIMRGLFPLRNVCLSFMGGCQTKWYKTMLPEEVYTGGFMSRFVHGLFPSGLSKRKWKPSKPDPKLRTALKKGLGEMSTLEGKVVMTPEADKWITEWYEITGSVEESSSEELLEAYYARKPEHVIRLAMLLEICEHGVIGELGLQALKESLEIVELLESQTKSFILEQVGDQRTLNVQKVLDILRKPQFQGKLSRMALIQKSFRYLPGKTAEFDEIIRTLREGGYIREEPRGDKKGDIWYRVTGSGKTFTFRRS